MKETISAMMDGELDEPGSRKAMAQLAANQDLDQAWDEYHLIGDAMRANRMLSVNVRPRVAERLAAEPTVLAPRRWMRPKRAAGAVALAASVSFAAVVGWQQLHRPAGVSLVADKGVPVQVEQPHPLTAQDDSYLLAHQEVMAGQGAVKVAYGSGVRR